ncbi:TPA: dATP/dGTP pyrophosphohydrolase domain-containing protein [Klebsiella quasipneumoniae]
MDSEPNCKERKLFCSTDTARMRKVISASAGAEATPLYRHAQPAPERDQVRSAHAEWSQATFGNVGPVGPLKHLSKEALEAAEQPGDLSEWADMQFLMWDAQRRAGITDEQITQAMIDKLAVNKQREWPEPKDGEPRLHIKGQPAPVVPDGYVMVPKETTKEMIDAGWLHYMSTKNPSSKGTYKAMLAAAPQSPGSEPATVPGKWIPVSERMPDDDDFVYIWPRPDFGVELHVGQYCECSPKGDGWYAQVYEQNYGIEWHPITVTHWMPLPAGPKEDINALIPLVSRNEQEVK